MKETDDLHERMAVERTWLRIRTPWSVGTLVNEGYGRGHRFQLWVPRRCPQD